MTPETFIANAIINHPILYAVENDYKASKLLVLEQLFNVLGNGLNLDEINKQTRSTDLKKLEATLTQDLFYGYTKIDKMIGSYVIPDFDSNVATVVEADKVNYPDVVYWSKIERPDAVRTPYPNFEKNIALSGNAILMNYLKHGLKPLFTIMKK